MIIDMSLPFPLFVSPSSLFQALIFTFKLNSEGVGFSFMSNTIILLYFKQTFFFKKKILIQKSHMDILLRIKRRSLVFFTNLYNSLVNNAKRLLSTSGDISSMRSSEKASLIKDLRLQGTWTDLLVHDFLILKDKT